jgi:signal transduction histidine kinase
VIGAAVLVLGLLLVMAAFVATRIPGGALARPGIGRFLVSPISPATWYANLSIAVGVVLGLAGGGLVLALASTGFTTLLGGIGFAFIAVGIEASRLVARAERWRTSLGMGTAPLPHPYRPLRGGITGVLRALFADENRWRDVLYVAINLPVVAIELVVVVAAWALALGLATIPFWHELVEGRGLPGAPLPVPAFDDAWVIALTIAGIVALPIAASLSQLIAGLHRGLVTALLCTSESRELRRQVAQLRESRSAVLDVEASELHRIERDLHDGAQQRLVALTIDLGLAGERVATDPEGAKRLIAEGQEQAREALAEIRQLVRGIAPSILLDRGVQAALESIAGRGPVPTVVVSSLSPGERLPAAVERAAYFVASEALANVARHSGASRSEVRLRREGDRLVVEVWDDGRGGARASAGSGLAGLEGRVAGVDGTFSVSSPDGGPTLVRAEIPIGGGGPGAPDGGAGAVAPG